VTQAARAQASEAAPAKRGRPSTGARERILEAAIEVLKADGYAGLTIAKVAAVAGESKALVAYHYGSKQGLVKACGREVAELITAEALAAVDGATNVEEVIRGSPPASSGYSTATSASPASTSTRPLYPWSIPRFAARTPRRTSSGASSSHAC
jgi:AcrR family transcriptional regulator